MSSSSASKQLLQLLGLRTTLIRRPRSVLVAFPVVCLVGFGSHAVIVNRAAAPFSFGGFSPLGCPPTAFGRTFVGFARAPEMGSKRVFTDSLNPEVPVVVEDKRGRKSRAVAAERLNSSDSAGKKGDALEDKSILVSRINPGVSRK